MLCSAVAQAQPCCLALQLVLHTFSKFSRVCIGLACWSHAAHLGNERAVNQTVSQSVGFRGHLQIHGGKMPSVFLPVVHPQLLDPGNPHRRSTEVKRLFYTVFVLQEMFEVQGLTLGLKHTWGTPSAWVNRKKVSRSHAIYQEKKPKILFCSCSAEYHGVVAHHTEAFVVLLLSACFSTTS